MSQLYSADLLRLTLGLAAVPRLIDPQGTATRRSRSCGSVIIADVDVRSDGSIERLGLDVRACAVGQASAAILSDLARGGTSKGLTALRDGLAAYLAHEGDCPAALIALAPVAHYPARAEAALLPFDAVLAAIDAARSASRNAATADSSTSVATNA